MSLKHLLDRQVEFSLIGSLKTRCLLEIREDASLPLVREHVILDFLFFYFLLLFIFLVRENCISIEASECISFVYLRNAAPSRR